MKEEKFQKIVEEISEFLGEHNQTNHHYLFDEDIIKIFSHHKKKHVKRALEELR
jgi:Holliday junction resolvase-like predicted endonuclease